MLATPLCSFCENSTSCTPMTCALKRTQVQQQYRDNDRQGGSPPPCLPTLALPRLRHSHFILGTSVEEEQGKPESTTSRLLECCPKISHLKAGVQGLGHKGRFSCLSHAFSSRWLIQLPVCDELVSHLKTQINYSLPTNEQPLVSRSSPCSTNTQSLSASHSQHRWASRPGCCRPPARRQLSL